jgi:serine protease Do
LGKASRRCPPTKPAAPTILKEFDEALDVVAERAMMSVVEIKVTGYGVPENAREGAGQVLERERVLGSGVIVDSDGYIMTNNHVVAGATRIRVVIAPATTELIPFHTSLSQPERVYEATLIGTNHYADLALIKIEEKNLPTISLPEKYQVRLGQTVLAIGAPGGLDHTVTKGIVSSVGRQPDLDRPMVYVQTDAPINPGNNGGPLIDRDGNLVGINTFIFTSGGGSEGLGFAIPEPIVRFAYYAFKTHGSVPPVTIGAHAQTITLPLANALKLSQKSGVLLSDVVPGGPAAKAGLMPNDVVTMIDGFAIDSLPKYTAFLYLHPVDSPMAMEVSRGGRMVSAPLKPDLAPPSVDNLSELINPKTDLIASLGIFTIDMKGELMGAMGTRSKTGVMVAGILGGEPITLANLEVGDLIYSMNGQPVTDTNGLRRGLAAIKQNDAVVFGVERQECCSMCRSKLSRRGLHTGEQTGCGVRPI